MAGTDFGIAIRIDPGNSKSGIDGLTSSLDKLEAAGPKAAAAATAGMKAMGDAAKAAAPAVAALTEEEKQFERTLLVANAQLAQEKAMLEQILGPIQKQQQGIEALDRLYDKGKITIGEYADQVTRLNQALDRAQPAQRKQADALPQMGPIFDPAKAGGTGPSGGVSAAAGGGGIGDLAGMMGIGVGLGAITATVKSLFEANDAYHQLENSVRKFADASGGLDATMTQQRDLAVAMHSNMAETIALYDRVTQATRNLYLTQVQQRDITEGLGIQAKLANVSLEEAAGIMKKFTIAADTGTFSMRLFRDLGMNMPQMLKALADHFGMNVKAFEDMAIKGRISSREIAIAMAGMNNEEAQKKLEEHTRSATDDVQKMAFAFVDVAAHQKKFYDDAVRGGTEAVKFQDKQVAKAQEHIAQVRIMQDVFGTLNDVLALTKRVQDELFADAVNNRMKTFSDNISGANAKLKLLNDQQALFVNLTKAGIKLPAGMLDATDRDVAAAKNEAIVANDGLSKSVLHVIQAETDHVTKIKDYNKALADGNITGEQHKALLIALAAEYKKLESEAEKLADRLVKQAQAFGNNLAALEMAKHRVSLEQYNEELAKLVATFAGADVSKMLGELRGESLTGQSKFAADLEKINELYARQKISLLELLQLREKLDELHDQSTIPRSVTNGSLGASAAGGIDIGAGLDGQDAKQRAIAAHRVIEDALAGSGNATAKYNEEVQKLNHSLIGLTPDAEEYQKALAAIRDRYNDMKSPDEQFAKGMQDIKDKVDAQIYSLEAADRAMRKLREATGRGTFGDGFDSFVENLKKQGEDSKASLDLLNQGMSSLNTGITDLIQGKGSFQDWLTSLIDGFEKVVAQILLTRAALALFGAPSSGGGLASIAAIAIPGHASGAYYPPGGSGGTDSQFIAFRKSPSEDVLVRTPEQRAAMAQGGGTTTVQHFNYNDYGDPRGLAPLRQELADLRAMVQRSRQERR